MWLQVHTIPGTKALVSSPQKLGILAPWFPTNNSSYQSKIHSLVKMDASSVTAKMLKQYDTWKGKNRTQQICRKCGLQKAPLTKLLAPTKKICFIEFHNVNLYTAKIHIWSGCLCQNVPSWPSQVSLLFLEDYWTISSNNKNNIYSQQRYTNFFYFT